MQEEFEGNHVLEMQIAWAVFGWLANPRLGHSDPIEIAGIFAFVAIVAIDLWLRFFAPPPANKLAAGAY